MLVFLSCSSNDSSDVNKEIGVHKMIVELEGNEEVSVSFSFVGTTTKGVAKLYSNNEYVGNVYSKTGSLAEISRVNCYTEDFADNLTFALVAAATKENMKISYKVTAYVNNDVVREVEKTVTLNAGQTETLNLSTIE